MLNTLTLAAALACQQVPIPPPTVGTMLRMHSPDPNRYVDHSPKVVYGPFMTHYLPDKYAPIVPGVNRDPFFISYVPGGAASNPPRPMAAARPGSLAERRYGSGGPPRTR